MRAQNPGRLLRPCARSATHGAALVVLAAVLTATGAWGQAAVQKKNPIRISIETPATGAVVEGELHMAELRGAARAAGAEASGFDVMLVVDTSLSMRTASGADVDEDGDVGQNPDLMLTAPGEYPEDLKSTDPEDTILHASVKAANVLLDGLDPRLVKVGLVTFAGGTPGVPDARVRVPLTVDFAQVRAALDRVLTEGPEGGTNFAAGIRLATTELAGMTGATSRPREGARKVMLFLTDGTPGLPAGSPTQQDPGDLEAAFNAARVAQAAGIRINSYALGLDALAKPKAVTELARVTLGTFTPVLEPGAIVAALQSVSFANVEDVGVVNLTTRENAPDVRLNPDGSFQAFVPVKEGKNRVLVNALASDGSEENLEIEFTFRVNENLDERMMERELARLRRLNDELIRHVEAEKIRRARRRERLKTRVEIEAEDAP